MEGSNYVGASEGLRNINGTFDQSKSSMTSMQYSQPPANAMIVASAESFDPSADYIGHYETHQFLQQRPTVNPP